MPKTGNDAARQAAPLERLLRVMAALRAEGGCPWDREQTHRSLIPFLIEESYELIEVIESTINGGGTRGGNGEGAGLENVDAALLEELGDVLLQVVFHAQIASERGAFSFQDIAGALADKLESRHPHVFGGATLPDAEAVREAWHRGKMRSRDSAMDGAPPGQPALQWALQISQRAARGGFEWEHKGEIHDKMAEEMAEFREALSAVENARRTGGSDLATLQDAAELEFGDLLFSLVQLARWEGIDPETALRRATRKFSNRFRYMESALRTRGLPAEKQAAGQWWALWDEAKAATE